MAPSNDLIAFYEGKAEDIHGRSLEQILEWPANKLEKTHNYIQLLFPLPERSLYNDSAPILDKEVFDAFRSREELRGRLRDSFEVMLRFYGLRLCQDDDGKLEVRAAPTLHWHPQYWLRENDHNHQRITRIIRSLRILGLEEEAQAFYTLIAEAEVVSPVSREYWARAATRPLNLAPVVENRDVKRQKFQGPKFLQDFVKKSSAEVK